MTTAIQNTSFQWLVDAGVDRIEVLWLERICGTPHVGHPVAIRRIRNMLSDARQGMAAVHRLRLQMPQRA